MHTILEDTVALRVEDLLVAHATHVPIAQHESEEEGGKQKNEKE